MLTKIAIGMPTNGTMKSKTAFSLLEMIQKNSRYEFFPIFRYGNYSWDSREKMADLSLATLCSHYLSVDADMSFPHDALPRLIAHDKDIVGVNYHYRYQPLEDVTRYLDDARPQELHEVIAAGTGFLLIKASVFSKIPKPYFPVQLGEDGGMYMTEDVGFCEKARAHGLQVWIDPTIKVGHVGDYEF